MAAGEISYNSVVVVEDSGSMSAKEIPGFGLGCVSGIKEIEMPDHRPEGNVSPKHRKGKVAIRCRLDPKCLCYREIEVKRRLRCLCLYVYKEGEKEEE